MLSKQFLFDKNLNIIISMQLQYRCMALFYHIYPVVISSGTSQTVICSMMSLHKQTLKVINQRPMKRLHCQMSIQKFYQFL